MKSLIIYYSLTNKTKLVSETVAKELGSDLRPLVDKVKRKGIVGFVKSGFHALNAKRTKLINPDFDISKYDLILIGTPVWAGRPTPAILTLFDNLKIAGKNVIVFATMGGNADQALKIMAGYVKQKKGNLAYMFAVKTGGVSEEKLISDANEFAKQIKGLNL